jgi:hypothetical protein
LLFLLKLSEPTQQPPKTSSKACSRKEPPGATREQ